MDGCTALMEHNACEGEGIREHRSVRYVSLIYANSRIKRDPEIS